MYGDPRAIRHLADRMREHAVDIRREADALARHVDAVHWTGVAAGAMRRLTQENAGRLRACAEAHDLAAEALEHHARAVGRARQALATATHDAHEVVGSAASGLRSLTDHLLPGPVRL